MTDFKGVLPKMAETFGLTEDVRLAIIDLYRADLIRLCSYLESQLDSAERYIESNDSYGVTEYYCIQHDDFVQIFEDIQDRILAGDCE